MVIFFEELENVHCGQPLYERKYPRKSAHNRSLAEPRGILSDNKDDHTEGTPTSDVAVFVAVRLSLLTGNRMKGLNCFKI